MMWTGGGGALNFFSGRGVRPGFQKCGACELTFASEKGGLWAENFQIWRLVSWKFPNLGACELKISNFGACELKFGWKLRLLRLKFPNFLKRGLVNWLFCLKGDPCERQERREKGVFRAAHPHTPFLGQCPPPGMWTHTAEHWCHQPGGGGGLRYAGVHMCEQRFWNILQTHFSKDAKFTPYTRILSQIWPPK